MKSFLALFMVLAINAVLGTSLKESSNSADILVITRQKFVQSITSYKTWRGAQGFDVKIVTLEEILAEFPSLQYFNSIKEFMDVVFIKWYKHPQYALLVGSYMALPSYPISAPYSFGGSSDVDNYYVIEEEEDIFKLRIPIGRLAVDTAEQLDAILLKLRHVESNKDIDQYGFDFLFIADDGPPGDNLDVFEHQVESLVSLLPANQRWQRMDLDSSSQFYGTRIDLFDFLQRKPLFLYFAGLANAGLWGHESILTSLDVDSMNNINTPFFILGSLCESFYSSNPREILIQRFLCEPEKGAFGAIASTGPVFTNQFDSLAQNILKEMFRGSSPRLGDIFLGAMNSLDKSLRGVSELAHFFSFSIIGDPCLILPLQIHAHADIDKDHSEHTFELKQNYPNPFNPRTTIEFFLATDEIVDLKVYNVLGQPVATLLSKKPMPAGTYSIPFDGSHLLSGSYIYTLSAGELQQAKRMVLLK
ncbi:T9SS type A sorting domain-containing protein [candidate division KSB1 bacterium]|nr:T9SS type A sorting domain-containing protein [candidate division KSB1 bacterium]RQW08523.1 MAG: T9SS C-terminal target domain-containing protein [candidate division KSB1 bacterium]